MMHVFLLVWLATFARAVHLDQPPAHLLPAGPATPFSTVRQLVTSKFYDTHSKERELRARLARFGLTLAMTPADVDRYLRDPRDPVFTPLRAIDFTPFARRSVDRAVSVLEENGVFLVLDFEKMMSEEAQAVPELRYHRFPNVGPRTMESIQAAVIHRGWTKARRFDLTELAIPGLPRERLEQHGLFGVVGEQELLRAGLSLDEVLRIVEALRSCQQLL